MEYLNARQSMQFVLLTNKSKNAMLLKHTSFLSLLVVLLWLTACQLEKAPSELSLEELTLSDIHQAYQAGDYSSVDLVKAYLQRIDSLNKQTNALTILNPDALNIAQSLDKEFQETGVLRPLHGIPLIVKDNINTAGLPTTAGALALQDYIPDENAFIIQKLVDAGAIILAKSNMAEWAFSAMHTESSTAGTTSNPYDPERVPAGSSGGTAAAVASNLGALGLGTDTGNSIRGPSSHCALVGFRTTLGLISRSAIVPLYLRNDVVGPMCRTVEDATRVMEVMVGYDPKDPITMQAEGKREEDYQQFLQKDGLQGSRIGVLQVLSEGDSEVIGLFRNAVEDLRVDGAEVIDSVVVLGFEELRQDQWCADFREDLEAFLQTYVQRDTIQTLEDMVRIGTTSEFAAQRLERLGANRGRWGEAALPCGDAYTDVRRIAFREAIERTMDSLKLDALIYPTWSYPPAHLDRFSEEYRGDNNQVIAPHTGQPAFTVPMGYTSTGLPTGLQFLGRMYAEPTLIRLTYAYEQATGHRKPPQLD